MGTLDQRETVKLLDVLVYTSDPLASTAVYIDFVEWLVDVYPSDRAFNLVDGIVRMDTETPNGGLN